MIYKINLQGLRKLGYLGAFGLGFLQIIVFSGSKVLGQNIVPDNTLGNENSRVEVLNSGGSPVDRISGGALRGKNLFHSFQEFNINDGSIADFINPSNNIQNILTRVTGNNPSNIFGTLKVSNLAGVTSNPNFFLINPNGIVFGENAKLDVSGSFVASTANALQFGEQGFFSATQAETPQLLTVNPSAFLFNQIANQPVNSIQSQAFLSVPTNKSLLLVGGNISANTASTGKIVLNGGRLRAPGGRIEIGGLGEAGKINLNTIDSNFSLGFPEDVKRVDVSLLNLAEVDVTAGGGGDISIYGQNLDIVDGSDICAGIGADTACGGVNSDNGSPGSQAGDITLDALENITIANPASEVNNKVNSGAVGNSGDINVKAKFLSIGNQSGLLTHTSGVGNAGSITINAREIQLSNTGVINSGIRQGGIGKGGDINIQTDSLSLFNRSQINSIVFGEGIDEQGNTIPGGKGDAGDIKITASDKITLFGVNEDGFSSAFFTVTERGANGSAGDISVETGNLRITEGAIIGASTSNDSDAGQISINANNIELLDGAQIVTATRDRGDAGKILLNVTGNITLEGVDSNFEQRSQAAKEYILNNPLQRFEEVRDVIFNEGAASGIFANTTSNSTGNGGIINLQGNSLTVNNGAQITARSQGIKEAGNININLRDSLTARNGEISTTSEQSSGGAIDIKAENIRLFGDSDIRNNVNSGTGAGGNINLTAKAIISVDDSDILSFARGGKGGDITFNTEGFFSSSQFRLTSPITNPDELDGNDRVDINASGRISGNITGIPDTTFIQNSITELPENQIDINALISRTCVARQNDTGSTFIITGSGGFADAPGNADISNYPTNQVRGIPKTTSSNWKKGDPIIEPDGVYRLPDGKIVLSHKCS